MDIPTMFLVKCYKNVVRRQWGRRRNTEIWWLYHTYVAGLSEAIQMVGNTVGIKTVFSSGDTLKKRLTHVKPKGKGKEKDLIYKIPCEFGAKYRKINKI
jgi:hypothetical protein